MFKKILSALNRPHLAVIQRLTSSNHSSSVQEKLAHKNVKVLSLKPNIPNDTPVTLEHSDGSILYDYNLIAHEDNKGSSVLEPCQEDISHVAPYLKPTFNFAAYVNKSETLQKLVHLGVDLYKLEKNVEVPPYLLRLDFENDMKNHLLFLHDLGLEGEEMGNFITKNPFIFREDIDNLKVRVNYLKSKKFDDAMILRIVQANPLWLNFSTQEIDRRLGFFQHTFSLNGNEVRLLATKCPKLITYPERKVKRNFFVVKEEMGFDKAEMKNILLSCPKVFQKDQQSILKTFEYVHKNMKIPLETIAKMPTVLTCREFRIKQRHLFLETLGKCQFDPKKPNYISLVTIASGSDAQFATEVAGSSVLAFNAFLKTL